MVRRTMGLLAGVLLGGCFSEESGPGGDGDDSGTATSASATATADTSGPTGSASGMTSVGTMTDSADSSTEPFDESGGSTAGESTGGVEVCPPPAAVMPSPANCDNGVFDPGEWCPDALMPLPDIRGAGVDLDAVDIDADGLTDLVVANGGSKTMVNPGTLLIGDGFGDFEAVNLPGDAHASSIAIGDLDGAGGPDLVVGIADGGGVVPYLNDGGTSFTMGAASLAGTNPVIEVADASGDQLVDAYVGAGDQPHVDVLVGDGLGGLSLDFERRINFPGGIEGVRSLALGQLDRDSPPDLVVAAVNNTLWYALGTAIGAPTPMQLPLNVGAYPQRVRVVDIDGDDDHDIVVAALDEVAILDFEGGKFQSESLPMPDGSAYDVELVDLDRNTRVDIVVINAANHSVRIYPGLPDGGFGMPYEVPLGAGTGPRRLVAGLFDDDCAQDLISANLFDESLSRRLSTP